MILKKGSKALEKVLNELIDYTVYHFETEEKLMHAHGYEKLDEHKKIHKELVAQIGAFREKFLEGNAAVDVELTGFLKNWILNHIQETDKQYTPFFHSKGIN